MYSIYGLVCTYIFGGLLGIFLLMFGKNKIPFAPILYIGWMGIYVYGVYVENSIYNIINI
jgi:hypothetical protein